MDRKHDIPEGWRRTKLWRPVVIALLFLLVLFALWASERPLPQGAAPAASTQPGG